MTGDIENQLTVLKETGKQKNNVANGRFNGEVSYFFSYYFGSPMA